MQAILNLDELRQFNGSLGMICGQLRERKDHINAEFKSLHEVWRDGNYRNFEETFTSAIAEIDRFLSYAEMYGDYLNRKAVAADQYLHRR